MSTGDAAGALASTGPASVLSTVSGATPAAEGMEADGAAAAARGVTDAAFEPEESDVVGVRVVVDVGAGASGRAMVGPGEDVDVTGDDMLGRLVEGMLAEGVGTVGSTIVGVLEVVERSEVELGGVIVVVEGRADVEGSVVVVGGETELGRAIVGDACWAMAEVGPSARTAAIAALARSERVGTWCVMNTTMRRKSKGDSLTCAVWGKSSQIKRRTAFHYAR
ncbi:hypothetical protein [Novosphingobium aquimarinum]|uniref:hypothetical protein n=1 Tax=Novosphingobium aquimarinum TaxID=2682494 RepID=UPI0012EB63AF|nr:hypothetical protein [Novosphingobium aquimarinum]